MEFKRNNNKTGIESRHTHTHTVCLRGQKRTTLLTFGRRG